MSSYCWNQAQLMQLFVTTYKRCTQEGMETLKNWQYEEYLLLCHQENASVCSVQMELGRLLSLAWLVVYKALYGSNMHNYRDSPTLKYLNSLLQVRLLWKDDDSMKHNCNYFFQGFTFYRTDKCYGDVLAI